MGPGLLGFIDSTFELERVVPICSFVFKIITRLTGVLQTCSPA